MKIGEVWKYKNWVCLLVNKTSNEHTETADVVPLDIIRIEILALHEEIVWFKEIKLEDSEYRINRETFIQIFEKVYED